MNGYGRGMVTMLLLHYIVLSACSQSKPQEDYGVVTIKEYKNLYDIIGRLSSVEIKEIVEMPHHRNEKDEAFVLTYCGLQQYEYKSDSEYTMKESYESSDESRIIRYDNKTVEELHLENGKDTVMYTFERYYDEDKPEYSREKWRDSNNMFIITDNETYYVYDDNGNIIKRIETNFLTNESKQEIIRNIKQTHRDTIITQVMVNDVLDRIEKEFTDGIKKVRQVQFILDNDTICRDTRVEYEKDGLMVNVSKSVGKSICKIDSIYSKNGIKVRTAQMSSDKNMKIEITSEYDAKGNIVKEIMKTKHNVQ